MRLRQPPGALPGPVGSGGALHGTRRSGTGRTAARRAGSRTARSLAARAPSGDAGSAVVEFVTVGVLMLVPVVYLVVAVAGVQAAAFATESAAREAARIVVTTPDEDGAEDRVVAAVGWALRDQGIEADPARAAVVECSARPCLTPGADVTVTVRVDVPLPIVPAGVSEVVPLVVPVSASHTQVVGEFEVGP